MRQRTAEDERIRRLYLRSVRDEGLREDTTVEAVADAFEWAYTLFRDPDSGGTPLMRSELEDIARLAVTVTRSHDAD